MRLQQDLLRPFRLTKAPRRKAASRKRPAPRRSLIEALEPRQMLTSDFNNALNPLDVTGDGVVTEEDLTRILAELDNPTVSDPSTGELTGDVSFPQGWVNDLPSGPVDQGELDGVLLHWGSSQSTTGDYDASGIVDQGDLDLVLLNWGAEFGQSMAGPPHYDVDCDGYVSPVDAAYVSNWLTDPAGFTGQQLGSITHSMIPSWSVLEHGGSTSGNGRVISQACTALLSEGDSFVVSMSADLTIPEAGTAIQISYDDLSFDERDVGFINDAFEIALVDRDGNPLVENFTVSRDALFNVSEEASAIAGDAIQLDGQTITLGLSDIPTGTEATLILRLVNNDGDTDTSVRITDVTVIESDLSGGAPRDALRATLPTPAATSPTPIAPQSGERSGPITISSSPQLGSDGSQSQSDFNVKLEWSNDTFTTLPASSHIMTTPMIADLNGDQTPEVVVITATLATLGNGVSDGHLRALSGIDGSEIWTVDDPQLELVSGSNVAIGDIDADGLPEIVAVHEDRSLVAFEHDGSLKWKSQTLWAISAASISIANLDGEGLPEIVAGANLVNADGQLVWSGNEFGGIGGGGAGSCTKHSIVVDLDLDGIQEVVAGKSAYRSDGSLLWNANVSDGFTAVGQFDTDDNPEIVLVTANSIHLLEHTGEIIWGPIPLPILPGGSSRFRSGGPPSIGDVTGDGVPEILVAGENSLSAFTSSGTRLWEFNTNEFGLPATTSALFDFDEDGAAEVIYADHRNVYIFAGESDDVLFQAERRSNTVSDGAAIADIDGDGSAEFIVGANNAFGGTVHGIFAYGSDDWPAASPIWNQQFPRYKRQR